MIDFEFDDFEGNYVKLTTSDNSSNWCYGDLIWNDKNTLLISQDITRQDLRDWMEACEVPKYVHDSIRGLMVRMFDI